MENFYWFLLFCSIGLGSAILIEILRRAVRMTSLQAPASKRVPSLRERLLAAAVLTASAVAVFQFVPPPLVNEVSGLSKPKRYPPFTRCRRD